MQEHRDATRHRVLKGAHIAFKDHGAAIDCVVRDMSEKGARLKVASPIGIPEAFDLVLEGNPTVRRCHVVWRKETQIGVEFR